MAAEEPPLPWGWVKALSSKHARFYWFNFETGETQWLPPEPSGALPPSQKRPRRDPKELRTAVIVPFRDLHTAQKRSEHLRRFVPYMREFFGDDERHKVFIVEQSNDDLKFNRGKLLNAGFEMAAREGFDLFVFHDVDLLPHRLLAPLYTTDPGANPLHIAGLWDRYSDNPRYCGGIAVFTRAQYRAINGFPNFFWGWGGEDDEMYKRVVAQRMRFVRPPRPEGLGADQSVIEDLEHMDIGTKMSFLKAHSDWKCNIKRELLEEHDGKWEANGLSNLRFKTVDRDDAFLGACVKVTVDLGLNGHEFSDFHARINVHD